MVFLNAAVGVDYTSIIITLVTVLGGTGAYNFYKRYMDSRDKGQENVQADSIVFRKTLIKRIDELESREELNRASILELTKENATQKAQIASLVKENEELRSRLG